MQKKIIALAIAGLASTAAFAQTNVTIYGIADAGFAYINQNGGTRNNVGEYHGRDTFAVVSGGLAGSRIGFKGTEDLGNGLKAVFVLEQGFNIDNGTTVNDRTTGTGAFQRQAFVGLSGSAGSLTLGRQYAPGYYAAGAYDALVASPFLSPLTLLEGATSSTIIGASSARWNNSINYASPNLGGFEAQVIYRMGEQANEININEGYGVGLKYAGGPVAVSYVFHHTESSSSGGSAVTLPTGFVPGTTGVQDEHFIGLSFDAKVVKVLATAQVSDWGNRQFAGKANRSEVYSLGAVVPVGKGNIHVAYAHADLNGAQNASFQGGRGSLDSGTIAYTHGLSKRTTLYTGLNYTDSSARIGLAGIDSVSGTYSTVAGNATGATTGGGYTTTFAAGINHAF